MILVFLILSKLQILREIMEEERAKIRYELEQKQAEEDRKREAAQQASVLRDQMEKLKLREKEVSGCFDKLKIFLIKSHQVYKAQTSWQYIFQWPNFRSYISLFNKSCGNSFLVVWLSGGGGRGAMAKW